VRLGAFSRRKRYRDGGEVTGQQVRRIAAINLITLHLTAAMAAAPEHRLKADTVSLNYDFSAHYFIGPAHQRTEGRAPVCSSEFTTKAATLQGDFFHKHQHAY
jgi:hypothetical protein